jgi:hypothetical protein
MRLIFASVLLAVTLGAGSVFLAGGAGGSRSSSRDPAPSASPPAKITIDYPLDGSVFPPEITPPTFLWHDVSETAKRWVVDVSFADRSDGIRVEVPGGHMQIGEIDPQVATDQELSRLTPEQVATRTWRPDAATWAKIKHRSVKSPATIAISGFARRRFTTAGIGRSRHNFHFTGSCRRACFLPRRPAAELAPRGERLDPAAAALRHSPHQMEVAKHWRAQEPNRDGQSPHLRQLSFVFQRRQNARSGSRWTEERQRAVRCRAGVQERNNSQSGCHPLEFLSGES